MVTTQGRLLVAIANHGTKSQQYLSQLLAAYRAMPMEVSIVVLSDSRKDLGPDVEVRVGAPTSNPWSLPFAHRQLFRDRLEDFDYFIYSEDDTLLDWNTMQAFIQSLGELNEVEIAGFLRTETSPEGKLTYSTCHSFFRWVPSSVRLRGGKLWAKYSNEHAACFVATQAQIRCGIASGGFPIEAHEGRHDMLCAAATDIYTQCGLERLVSLDELDRFSLPHLPNKYVGVWGLSQLEMAWQIDALRKVYSGVLSNYELFNPETLLPGSEGSKLYREPPDPVFNRMLGTLPRRVLVWGAGDGFFESGLRNCGHEVSVVPMDAVVGDTCCRRGLTVIPETDLNRLGRAFDAIVLRDILQLVEAPERLLMELRSVLTAGGFVVARIPNLNDARLRKLRLRDPRFKMPWSRSSIGATPFTARELAGLFKKCGFGNLQHEVVVPESRAKLNAATLSAFSRTLSPYLYIRAEIV